MQADRTPHGQSAFFKAWSIKMSEIEYVALIWHSVERFSGLFEDRIKMNSRRV